MSEAVREATPIEVLNRDLESILRSDVPLKENVTRNQVKDAVAKAMQYEQNYYNNQYVVISAHNKDLQKKVEVLEKQNRILTEYIIMKEKGIVECS